MGKIQCFFQKKPDIDAKDNEGMTPLMNAITKGDMKTIDFLMKQGANILARNCFGRAALEYYYVAWRRNGLDGAVLLRKLLWRLVAVKAEKGLRRSPRSQIESDHYFDDEDLCLRILDSSSSCLIYCMNSFKKDFKEIVAAYKSYLHPYDTPFDLDFDAYIDSLVPHMYNEYGKCLTDFPVEHPNKQERVRKYPNFWLDFWVDAYETDLLDDSDNGDNETGSTDKWSLWTRGAIKVESESDSTEDDPEDFDYGCHF
ncbi:hypothetical protein HDU96_000007 [Phlyctochytrium bullatum]|nr:hypothetical protein HDU96_000007 [Phlyctochytrium bullatum]